MTTFDYVFTSLRGRQAQHEFYVAMCPLRLVPKIFLFAEDEIPVELRAQRTLNRARVPEIAAYILGNRRSYIFSSITASIDGKVHFEPIPGVDNVDVGRLSIPMDAKFLINDGQHRRAAIEEALAECPELGEETISVVFFVDIGLKRSQQMFADLNKHAVRPTRSLGIYYDHRDQLSQLAKTVVEQVVIFRDLIDMEKTSLSNRTIKLFTLSSIYQGTLALLRKTAKDEKVSKEETKLAIEYWNAVGFQMKDWQLALRREVSTAELRREFVHAHALAVHALGRLGAELIVRHPDNWKKELIKLKQIDWSRHNTALWEGRAMIGGKISKAHSCVILTSNHLKHCFGLLLNPEEERIEQTFLQTNKNQPQ